jgi:cell shape-determining protein MreC
MPRSQQQPRLAILAMAWLIGGGLLAAPAEIGDALRAPIRDALGPGQALVGSATLRLRARLAEWRCGAGADERTSLRNERDLWRNRFLALQAQQAGDGDDHPAGTSQVVASDPLIVPDLIQARVLGAERETLRPRIARLLNRGRSDGVAVDDIVLDNSCLLLDIGTDARIQPDMPVLSGGSALGRIKQCGRWTCTVQPLTDPDFRAFVQLVRTSRNQPLPGAEGVLAGNGDGACRLELVDATQPVSIGDFVYGRLEDFDGPPPCYGRVTAAELTEGAAHWNVTVTPVSTLDDQRTVQILRELPNPVRMAELNQASSH